MSFLVVLHHADNVSVISLPVRVERGEETVNVLFNQEGLKQRVHRHFRGIIVVLIIRHVSGLDKGKHSVQHGGKLEISVFSGNRVLVVYVHLKVFIRKKEVQNLIGFRLVGTVRHHAKTKVDTGI